MSYKTKFQITIPSRTEFLKMIVEITTHFSVLNGFNEKEAKKIGVVVDEAVTNVIKHSYEYKKDEFIKITFESDRDSIRILLEFKGLIPEIEDSDIDLKKYVKDKKKGGLGVNLMRKIMDNVKYYTENEFNYCEMIKWKKKK